MTVILTCVLKYAVGMTAGVDARYVCDGSICDGSIVVQMAGADIRVATQETVYPVFGTVSNVCHILHKLSV